MHLTGYNNNAPLLDATCGCRCARLISNEKWVENETHLPIQGYIVLFRLSKAKSIIENASAPALLSVVIGKTLTPFGTLLFKWISAKRTTDFTSFPSCERARVWVCANAIILLRNDGNCLIKTNKADLDCLSHSHNIWKQRNDIIAIKIPQRSLRNNHFRYKLSTWPRRVFILAQFNLLQVEKAGWIFFRGEREYKKALIYISVGEWMILIYIIWNLCHEHEKNLYGVLRECEQNEFQMLWPPAQHQLCNYPSFTPRVNILWIVL